MDKRLKRKYKNQFSSLRDLINSWNLIPDSTPDEFDSLNHLCLSLLNKDADEFKLKKSIYHELTVNYGFSIGKEDSDTLAKEVIKWWIES